MNVWQYEIGLKQVLSNTRQYSSHHPEVWNLLNSRLFANNREFTPGASPAVCSPCLVTLFLFLFRPFASSCCP